VEALGEASSHEIQASVLTLLGERSGACDAVGRAKIAELLIVVLTGLGGASQERSAARICFKGRFTKEIYGIFHDLHDSYPVNPEYLVNLFISSALAAVAQDHFGPR
jgi:hypothetical protein